MFLCVQGVFDHRMKTWQKWQDTQMLLHKKQEAEAKLQFTNKPDKLQQAKDEIKEVRQGSDKKKRRVPINSRKTNNAHNNMLVLFYLTAAVHVISISVNVPVYSLQLKHGWLKLI